MRIQELRGQTGIAVLALGILVYIHLQVTQLAKQQEIAERERQEMADALKSVEEQIRGASRANRRPGSKPRL